MSSTMSAQSDTPERQVMGVQIGIADGQEGSCARVTSVGQLTGPTPHYGNPKDRADFFDLTTGELREANARLPAAGTYKTWRKIDPPDWALMHLAQV